MQRFRFPLAVALTSLGLVGLLVLAGGWYVSSTLASSPFGMAADMAWRGGPPWQGAGNHAANLPPELQGLADLPPAEKFAHFRGVQVQLTDKDSKPFNVSVAAGTATAASASSLTMAGNDGANHTYTLDAQTTVHSRRQGGGAQSTIAQGDKVVVVTLNGSDSARAVIAFDPNSVGPRGPFGH